MKLNLTFKESEGVVSETVDCSYEESKILLEIHRFLQNNDFGELTIKKHNNSITLIIGNKQQFTFNG